MFSKFYSDCGWIRPQPSRPSMLNVTGSGVCRDERNSILVSIHTGIRIHVFEIKRKLITVCMHSLVCHATLGWAWQLALLSSRYDTYNKSRTYCASIRCIIIPSVIEPHVMQIASFYIEFIVFSWGNGLKQQLDTHFSLF